MNHVIAALFELREEALIKYSTAMITVASRRRNQRTNNDVVTIRVRTIYERIVRVNV